MVVMEEKDQKDKRNQTETSEKEFESLSDTDVQLLREAGRICAEQDIEKMFPADRKIFPVKGNGQTDNAFFMQ